MLAVNGSNLNSGVVTLVWNGTTNIQAAQGSNNTQPTFCIDPSLIATPGNVSIQLIDAVPGDRIASGFNSGAGTFNFLQDNVSGGTAHLNKSITGATYNVAADGRATVSYASCGTTHNYVYYLDNSNDGYILGLDKQRRVQFVSAAITRSVQYGNDQWHFRHRYVLAGNAHFAEPRDRGHAQQWKYFGQYTIGCSEWHLCGSSVGKRNSNRECSGVRGQQPSPLCD